MLLPNIEALFSFFMITAGKLFYEFLSKNVPSSTVLRMHLKGRSIKLRVHQKQSHILVNLEDKVLKCP